MDYSDLSSKNEENFIFADKSKYINLGNKHFSISEEFYQDTHQSSSEELGDIDVHSRRVTEQLTVEQIIPH